MSDAWGSAGAWLLRVSVGGGVLLLAAWVLMRWARQPARQQRLAESSMAAALILAILGLAPAWLIITLPWEIDSALAGKPAAELATRETTPEGLERPDSPYPPNGAEDPDRVGPSWLQTGGGAEDEPAFEPAAVPREATPDDVREDDAPDEASGAWVAVFQVLRTFWQDWGRELVLGAMGLWLAGALMLLGRWMLGYYGLWRLLGQTEPAPAGATTLLAELAGGKRPPRLLVSNHLLVPISCGLFRPTIVLPASLCRAADAATLRWVFAHELTHLERRDAWSTLLFALGQVVYFFLPWYWWMRREVRLCQEYIADAAAVAQHRQPGDYAQFLLNLTRAPALPAGATGVTGPSSDLFRRVTMLLQAPIPVERRCPWSCLAAMAGGLLGLAVIVSGIGLQVQAAPPVSAAEQPGPVSPPSAAAPAEADLPPRPKSVEPVAQPPAVKPARKPESDLPDIEQLLRRLPAGVDPRQVEQFRKDWEKASEDWRRALERARDDARRAFEQPRPLTAPAVKPPAARATRDDERRLGARLDRPSEILAEQLNLPRGQGLVVEQVQADSVAARAGIRPNDILLEMNGKPVSNDYRDLLKGLDDLKGNTAAEVVLLRKGQKETKRFSWPRPQSNRGSAPRFPFTRPQSGGKGSPELNLLSLFLGSMPAISTTRNGDQFTTRHREKNLTLTVTGTVAGRKVQVTEIRIEESGRKQTYQGLENVPEKHRDRVKNLIEKSGKSGLNTRNLFMIGH